jgi:hypothetical protein
MFALKMSMMHHGLDVSLSNESFHGHVQEASRRPQTAVIADPHNLSKAILVVRQGAL